MGNTEQTLNILFLCKKNICINIRISTMNLEICREGYGVESKAQITVRKYFIDARIIRVNENLFTVLSC